MESDSLNGARASVVSMNSKAFKRRNNNSEAKTARSLKSKKKKLNNQKARAAIYLGHIPHGFYENEMKSYFNQFGKVLAAKVARSKKTGRSKGYGFVEFADEEVAKIAAETMNNYLMFNKIIKCRYIPPEERKGNLFVRNVSVNDYPRQKNRHINLKNKTKAFAQLNQQTYMEKTQRKINEFRKFFEERGINFTFKIKDDENGGDVNYESELETPSSLHVESEAEDETDDQFGVLEIDESDSDINFKTPPQVKKVIKRFVNSSIPLNKPDSCKYSSAEKEKRRNSLENSNALKTQGEKNKINKRAKSCLPNIKKLETKKKLPAKVKTKKLASTVKQNSKSLKDLAKPKNKKSLKYALQNGDTKVLKKAKLTSLKL